MHFVFRNNTPLKLCKEYIFYSLAVKCSRNLWHFLQVSNDWGPERFRINCDADILQHHIRTYDIPGRPSPILTKFGNNGL